MDTIPFAAAAQQEYHHGKTRTLKTIYIVVMEGPIIVLHIQVKASRPRSYCEGMELVDLEKSWTA